MKRQDQEEDGTDPRASRWSGWMRVLVVAGLAGAGVAMMAGGLLAWVEGEHLLFVAGVVAGAVLVGAGGLGMLHCLDQVEARPGL